jgi:hypothetical protein
MSALQLSLSQHFKEQAHFFSHALETDGLCLLSRRYFVFQGSTSFESSSVSILNGEPTMVRRSEFRLTQRRDHTL